MTQPLRTDRAAVVRDLSEQLRGWEAARRTARWAGAGEVVSTGSAALDRLLPEKGFRRGSLVEWLAGGAAGGAGTLALVTAGAVLAGGGALVVIDRRRTFYPPAAARLGLPLEKLIVVRPLDEADHAWAVDQALRSRGVAAVWCAPERPDSRTLRRWQLAAETSGVVGLLLRGEPARHEPSWAELRLWVEPLAGDSTPIGRRRGLRVELLRSRTHGVGGAVELEIPTLEEIHRPAKRGLHETRAVPVASQLAAATSGRRSRRA